MTKFYKLSALLAEYQHLPDGMIYSVEKKENDLQNAVFYVVTSEESKEIEYTEGDLGEVPIEIYDDNFIVCELLETQIFKSIIENKLRNNLKSDFVKNIKVFVNAIEFYLEFDTFQE